MRELPLTLAAALLAVVCTGIAVADQDQGRAHPNLPLGNNPYPVLWGGQSNKPVQPAQPAPQTSPAHPHSHPYFFGGYRPYFGGVYSYNPYYVGYGYPYIYVPTYDYYYPPLRDNNDEAPEPKRVVERGTNAQAVARAWRFIGFGDARFAEHKYSEANQRYRSASASAPQLADAWFRQGFALIAMRRYEQSLTAIKRGLTLKPDWAKSDFSLNDLYGADAAAKIAHREALAEAAEAKPNDADLLFLIGLHLHFDGQADRAAPFFGRAQELDRDNPEHLRAFAAKP